MERECLVSVLCTAYNHEAYIRQTLQSFVEQQTDFAFEVLVNDDVSTDGTAAILREFAGRYPDIVRPFYQTENLFSRYIDIYQTVFMPAARGKYVAVCEGDDYWTDVTKLQRQVDFMEAHPEYSACVHNTILHDCSGRDPDRPLLHMDGDCDVSIGNVAKGVSYSFHTSSILTRAEYFRELPPYYFDGLRNGFSDHPFALWLMFNGKVRCLDRCMSVYRINSGKNAWSTGVNREYEKLRNYVDGERQLLVTCLDYAPEEFRPTIRHEITEREFELMFIEGRDEEQRRSPYREILRGKSLGYRMKNALKCAFPRLKRLYRHIRGYRTEEV